MSEEKSKLPYNADKVEKLENEGIAFDPESGKLVVVKGVFEEYIKDTGIDIKEVKNVQNIVKQFTIDSAVATGRTSINVMEDHEDIKQLDATWQVIPGLNIEHVVQREYTDNKGEHHYGRIDTKVQHVFSNGNVKAVRDELYELGKKKLDK